MLPAFFMFYWVSLLFIETHQMQETRILLLDFVVALVAFILRVKLNQYTPRSVRQSFNSPFA